MSDEVINLFPTVCEECKEKNLTEKVYLEECPECNGTYCHHFASGVDPAICINCCSKVEMTEQIVTKTVEHYHEETDTVTTKKSTARQIKFDGFHWLFFQRRIEQMDDKELLLSIEYHRAIYNAMMLERDKRRVEYFHRNAGKKFVVPVSGVSSTETTTTKVRKTRVIKPEVAAAGLKMLLEQLLKQGKTQEEIMKLLGAKQP